MAKKTIKEAVKFLVTETMKINTESAKWKFKLEDIEKEMKEDLEKKKDNSQMQFELQEDEESDEESEEEEEEFLEDEEDLYTLDDIKETY